MYKCDVFPYSVSSLCSTDCAICSSCAYLILYSLQGFCSQFDPTDNTGLGWKAVGHCRGTTSPTSSPTEYDGTCQYEKCVTIVEGGAEEDCVQGQTGCVDGKRKPDITVCSPEDVLNYSTTTDYDFGDVVRIGTQRYKCKEWPNGLWCNNPAYAPVESDNWDQAWEEDGKCLQSPLESE